MQHGPTSGGAAHDTRMHRVVVFALELVGFVLIALYVADEDAPTWWLWAGIGLFVVFGTVSTVSFITSERNPAGFGPR